MPSSYVPERGDLVWLQFDPRAGREQAGQRPALVVSPKSYNRRVGLALFCPITSRIKGYPFEVRIPAGLTIEGAVLSDQVKSLDWRARNAKHIGRLPDDFFEETVAKILCLIDPGASAR